MTHHQLIENLQEGLAQGRLLPSAFEHATQWIKANFLPEWALSAIQYLVDHQHWDELNDRFYTILTFGTGGLRGRTIGKQIAPTEQGVLHEAHLFQEPAHAAVGTAYLNDFNIIRSTIGLYRYSQQYLADSGRADGSPRLVIAYDVRYFSRHFAQKIARVWQQLGGEAYLFDGPRSTPQLSFTVRQLKATAGIVVTASHNPPHDNGYKVYFEDGGQVVDEQAQGIIDATNQVELSSIQSFLDLQSTDIHILSHDIDQAFIQAAQQLVLSPAIIRQHPPTIVYTSIHGTGHLSIVPALTGLGVRLHVVDHQLIMDSAFSSVASPNPENPETLAAAIELAKQTHADVALGTDPDADRMGVAIRTASGQYRCLTGNQIGALLAQHRIQTLKEAGWLSAASSAVLIKTFVTTPLQAQIAKAHGLKVVETLTGFKWIAAKLKRYEKKLLQALWEQEGLVIDYDHTHPAERMALLQKYSTAYVFGGEESYGFLANDAIRDKDATGACVLWADLLAHLKAQGQSIEAYLDDLYLQHGYFAEDVLNLVYEGATGAQQIQRILNAYRFNQPTQLGRFKVSHIQDFGQETILDADGDLIPAQDFFQIQLTDGSSFAVRASGTEPKIKFYLFAHSVVADRSELVSIQAQTQAKLLELKAAIQAHATACC